jgi:hypothetical protein
MVRKTTHVAARKRTIIERLTAGDAVAQAARAACISRAEAYRWKHEDSKFSAAWDDAVEEGIDMLETIAYRRAIDGNDGLLTLYLKCRRSEKWNPQVVERHIIDERNANRPVTLQEALAEMMRLGLPMPALECDYVEIESSATSSKSDDDPV